MLDEQTSRQTIVDVHIEHVRITIVRFFEQAANGVVSFLAHEGLGVEESVNGRDDGLSAWG
jgi:hypothetical protein